MNRIRRFFTQVGSRVASYKQRHKEQFQHSLVMRSDSWHYKCYKYWLLKGGKPPGYRENFCRYCRIVAIWSPLKWFTKGRIRNTIPPWTIPVVWLILSLTGIAFYVWPIQVLKVVVLLAIYSLAFGVIVVGKKKPNKLKRAVKLSTFPVWVLVAWVWKRRERELRAFGRWWTHPYYKKISLLETLVLGMITVTLGLFLYFMPIVTLIVIGVVLGVVVVIVGSIIGFAYLIVKVEETVNSRRRDIPLSGVVRDVADTVKLAATYKKGSIICPFIEFEEKPF